MNKLNVLFENKKENILSIFLTAGYPNLNSTVDTVLALDKAGVDLIELGIPFSDPMADGRTIQESSEIALKNGMNLDLLFQQVMEIRMESKIPIVLMGYLNPIYQYGLDSFLKMCAECEVDGLIIPDLPLEIYLEEYETAFLENNIPLIFLITLRTSIERIQEIDSISTAFIYLVSSASITGGSNTFSPEQITDFNRISMLNISTPILVGFGIHDSKTFNTVCEYFQGAIIGSAFIRHQKENKEVSEFIERIIR